MQLKSQKTGLKWLPRIGFQGGFTILEVVLAVGIMSVIMLAGTQVLQNTISTERELLESMDSRSNEVMVADRIYQDLKFAAPSFNFLMRFDDGRTEDEKTCRLTDAEENSPCYEIDQNFVPDLMADYDFYLYDPSCGAGKKDQENQCYRSVTLTANNTYPDGTSNKRDFVLITADISILNKFGVAGGSEFLNPADAFEFRQRSKGNWPSDCSTREDVVMCNHFVGLSWNNGNFGGLEKFLTERNVGRYLLLSSPIKQLTKLDEGKRSYDLGYPDLSVNYILRIVKRDVKSKNVVDVRPDFSLVSKEHLRDYKYAANYIDNNADEINFHDEEIFGGLDTSESNAGRWTHYYHRHPHPGEYLRILQAYNGTQTEYLVSPIRIVRYHLSDAYQRALEAGEENPDPKLKDRDPCLTRYIYRGSEVDGDGAEGDQRGRWVGVPCLYRGVKKITFTRPNVALPLISFKVYMQDDAERALKKQEKRDALKEKEQEQNQDQNQDQDADNS